MSYLENIESVSETCVKRDPLLFNLKDVKYSLVSDQV